MFNKQCSMFNIQVNRLFLFAESNKIYSCLKFRKDAGGSMNIEH